jgi:hypothetical protein
MFPDASGKSVRTSNSHLPRPPAFSLCEE